MVKSAQSVWLSTEKHVHFKFLKTRSLVFLLIIANLVMNALLLSKPSMAAGNTQQSDLIKGTKFHPGHYLMTQISRAYTPRERQRKRIELIEKHLYNPDIRGFLSHFEWKVLEPEKNRYELQNIEQILKLLEGSDKYFGIYIRDRNFSKDCVKAPVPGYLLQSEYGKPYKYKGATCMIELYNRKVVDRKLALYRAIAERFDRHPHLEIITDGETSIGGGERFSHRKWANEIKRFFSEAKKAFPHTMVMIQTNFLGEGEALMQEIAEHMLSVGGGALGLPDTVPCRKPDIPKEQICEYTIPGYSVLKRFKGKIAIAPNAETWDLHYRQGDEILSMAVNYLGADHVFWSSSFSSRRERIKRPPRSYLKDQILPMLKRRAGEISTLCPDSLKPCIAD